jgi:NACalpha-BTF3-like transcription factor
MTRGNTPNATLTEDQINQLREVLLSNNNQNANVPVVTSEETRDNDVHLVSTQAGVPLDVARAVLEECQGDIVAAIMEITMGPLVANVPDTFELPELNPLVAADLLD